MRSKPNIPLYLYMHEIKTKEEIKKIIENSKYEIKNCIQKIKWAIDDIIYERRRIKELKRIVNMSNKDFDKYMKEEVYY